MPELETGIGIERVIPTLAWLGLAHGLWIGLAAPAIAALVLRARPGLSRSARHRIVLGAFLLATVGPFVVGAAHREAARRSARGPVGVVTMMVGPVTEDAGPAVDRRETSPRGADRPSPRRPVARWAGVARPWVLACWASGLAGMVGMVGLGVCASRRLLQRCRPAPGTVEGEALRLARGLGLRRCPPVLVHDSVGEPCLCGVVRPSIVLPADWLETARPGVVSAVLAHELAHARRRDPLSNLIQRFLEALVLFHPGARRLSRALRLQREYRADALAVRLTGDPRGLAEALEGFARSRLAPRDRGPLGAALGGESSTLLPRIQEILDMTSKPERIGPWTLINLPVAAVLASAITTGGLARDEPAVTKAAEAPRIEAEAPPMIMIPGYPRPIALKGWEEVPIVSYGFQPPKEDGPIIAYEVRLLEGDDLLGLDPDFRVGEGEESVSVAFLSELEKDLVLETWAHPPSNRIPLGQTVPTPEGLGTLMQFPHEPGPDIDDHAPGTSVYVSGTIEKTEDREYVQLLVLLAEEAMGAGRPSLLLAEEAMGAGGLDREGAEGRRCRVTVPDGGTVILSTDDPDDEARGRRRVVMLTPRIVAEEQEKGIGSFNMRLTVGEMKPLKD